MLIQAMHGRQITRMAKSPVNQPCQHGSSAPTFEMETGFNAYLLQKQFIIPNSFKSRRTRTDQTFEVEVGVHLCGPASEQPFEMKAVPKVGANFVIPVSAQSFEMKVGSNS